MRYPKGFPKPRHYFAMKRRGLIASQTMTSKEQMSSDFNGKAKAGMPWWVWVLMVFSISALLRLCGYGL